MYEAGRLLGPEYNSTRRELSIVNEFDQYVKHVLRMKYYIRYADDFVFILEHKEELEVVRKMCEAYLSHRLKLTLHPNKVFLTRLASGVDFLGWVHFPHHKVLRTVTKRRMLRKINEENVASYLGMLQHGNAYLLQKKLSERLDKDTYI